MKSIITTCNLCKPWCPYLEFLEIIKKNLKSNHLLYHLVYCWGFLINPESLTPPPPPPLPRPPAPPAFCSRSNKTLLLVFLWVLPASIFTQILYLAFYLNYDELFVYSSYFCQYYLSFRWTNNGSVLHCFVSGGSSRT